MLYIPKTTCFPKYQGSFKLPDCIGLEFIILTGSFQEDIINSSVSNPVAIQFYIRSGNLMNQPDILFTNECGVFSLRIAEVLIREGKLLLQRTMDDPGYAYPGGHVTFGETSEQTLVREFKEEVGYDIRPIRLIWVGEIFFPWGERNCHQICLYYLCELLDPSKVVTGEPFVAFDEIGGERVDSVIDDHHASPGGLKPASQVMKTG
jgi:ADP-ribose pyrophosphatase YjhB (NUDIX family)